MLLDVLRGSTADRLRAASTVAIVLSGTVTGLLAALGWRSLREGDADLAVTLWVLAVTAVVGLVLIAGMARAVAALLERGMAGYRGVLSDFEDRLQRLERALYEPQPARDPSRREPPAREASTPPTGDVTVPGDPVAR